MVPTPGQKCHAANRDSLEQTSRSFNAVQGAFGGARKVNGGSRNYLLALAAIDQLIQWPFVGRVFPIVCISEIAYPLTMNEKHTIGSRSDLCRRRNAR